MATNETYNEKINGNRLCKSINNPINARQLKSARLLCLKYKKSRQIEELGLLGFD
jgi:hypothetical protein